MSGFWRRLRTCDRAALFGWLCVVVIVTAYTLIVFNRFMPPQEGWFNAFSRRILSGEMPYRDFYLFLQPVYPYLLTALNALFGFDFMVFRIYGVFERLFLVSMVYLVYGRLFKPWIAAFCAIASLVLCWSFNADPICSYYQLSVGLVLLALWLLLKFFDEEQPNKKLIYVVSAGVACSLSFMVKQTLGLAFPFVAVILIVLQSVRSKGDSRQIFNHLALFAAGCVSVIVVFSAFFLLTNSFDEYISQVFLGTSSKGSLLSILFGSIGRLLEHHLDWTLLFFTALIALASLYAAASYLAARSTRGSVKKPNSSEIWMWIAVVALPLISLVLPVLFLSYFETTPLYQDGVFNIKRSFVYSFFPISVILCVFYLHKMLFRSTSYAAKLAVAAASFVIIYVHGFSGVIEETSTILIFGFVVGLALSYSGIMNVAKHLVVMLIVSGIMLVSSVQKMTWPYGWWGWTEPSISQATTTVDIPRMTGIYLSERTADLYQTVYDSLKGHVHGDDYLYTFPHIKAFDNIFGGVPPTFADVHYWDVCPDAIAIADSEVLRASPPKAIVYMDLPEEAWLIHEKLFRDGAESGQRQIAEFIEEGVESGQYAILREIPAFENSTIYVLLRCDE